MNPPLIHIGLHKTGTTWMQNELFTSENDIFEPLYIDNRLNGHSTLAEEFIFDSQRNLLSPFDLNTEVILNSYQNIIHHKPNSGKIFVMSHERLSGHPTSSGFDASVIADRIKKVFPESKILIVIREQVSNIASNYFQYLKEGGILGIHTYLNTLYDGRRPGFGINYFKYHHLIEGYQERFGKMNVLVLPYELLQQDKEQFMEHLGIFVGQKIESQKINLEKKHNIKNNHFVDYHFRFLNKYIKSSSSLNCSNSSRVYQAKKAALKFKKYANKCVSIKNNATVKKKIEEEVHDWAKNKFENYNTISDALIHVKLKEFGYAM